MQEQINENRLELIGKKRLLLTGVISVDAFSEDCLKLSLNGDKLFITGENIKITAFSKATGNLQADGVFTSFKYNAKKQPILKRLFK